MSIQAVSASSFSPFSMSSFQTGSTVNYDADLMASDRSLMTATYGADWDRNGAGPNATVKVNVMAYGIVAARRDGTLQGPVTASFLKQRFGGFENMKMDLQNALDYLAATDGGRQPRPGHSVSFTA